MGGTTKPPGRDLLIRCPRLGHEIWFDYCRRENMGEPCFKVLDCWYGYFPVEEFLRAELGEQGFAAFVNAPGRPKMVALAEMIARAEAAEKTPRADQAVPRESSSSRTRRES